MATAEQSQPPAVSSITPAKPPTLRQQHHDAMLQAAKNALELGERNGVNIHIFGAPYKTKVGRKGTHGSRDAISKFKNGKDQTGLALAPWTGKYLAANPCIRLDFSGLVAIDVDHGFEGLSDERMIAKGEASGLPRTYTVRTGRANGGATFFYRGERPHPLKDCTFTVDELSGDVKHHGHVAAAGSLHKSGTFYRCINDAPLAPLPEFWRDYKHTKKATPEPLLPFREDCLRKEDRLRDADTSPLGLARKRAHDYAVRLRERLATGKVVKVKHGELVPKGRRRKYLTQQAGRMRKLSLDPEIIRIALDIRAIRKCWDGENFILSHKADLDFIAGLSASWQEGDYIMTPVMYGDELIGRIVKPPRRHDLLVAAMKKFPDQITASEGYDSLERELVGTRFTVERRSKASQRAVKKAREEAGFKVESPKGVCRWIRIVRRTVGE